MTKRWLSLVVVLTLLSTLFTGVAYAAGYDLEFTKSTEVETVIPGQPNKIHMGSIDCVNDTRATRIKALLEDSKKAPLYYMIADNNWDGMQTATDRLSAGTGLTDADQVPIFSAEAGHRRLAWSAIKAAIKAYCDTLYNKYAHPAHPARAKGLYKVTVDELGHVTGAEAVAKADITALGIPGQDTVYNHPPSGATAGAYRSVTVDTQGHVTSGSNPTLAVSEGGTGASGAAAARSNLGAAAKPVIVTATLTAAGWTGSAAPYTQTLSVAGTPADQSAVVSIGYPPSVTKEQMEAWAAGMVLGTAHAAGSITFQAKGDKPAISLPVQIVIQG